MFELLEHLADFLSGGDGYAYDTDDHSDMISGIDASGIDLSNYSTDEIEDAIRAAFASGQHDGIIGQEYHDAMFGQDGSFDQEYHDGAPGQGYHNGITGHGHDISFEGAPDVDARNLAKSNLLTKMSSNHIYTTTPVSTDKLWGGLDSYSGNKVADAINYARDHGNISDSTYKELLALLKKACHTQ